MRTRTEIETQINIVQIFVGLLITATTKVASAAVVSAAMAAAVTATAAMATAAGAGSPGDRSKSGPLTRGDH